MKISFSPVLSTETPKKKARVVDLVLALVLFVAGTAATVTAPHLRSEASNGPAVLEAQIERAATGSVDAAGVVDLRVDGGFAASEWSNVAVGALALLGLTVALAGLYAMHRLSF